MGIFSKMFKNQTVLTDWNGNFLSPSFNSQSITNDTALQIASVYACINIKSNAVAKLPLQVYQKTKDGRVRINNEVSYLLETRPNKWMSPYVFKHLITTHRNTEGVAYIKQEFDKRGKLQALIPLNPTRTKKIQDTDGIIKYIETLDNKTITYSEDEIIWLPYLTTDGITHKSPIQVLKETISTLSAQKTFLNSFYQNGTMTRGVLKIPTQLNKEAKDKVRQAWEQANSGLSNASKVAVLDAGMEFQNITIPLDQLEFIASQKFGIEEIARCFNVPLHMLNSLDRATFSNIEQQSMEFVLNTIQPEVTAWEEEMNYKLFTRKEQSDGYYIKFNLTSALRGDSASRANYYKTMLETGVYSINEIREMEEMDAITNGDKHRVDLNHVSLDIADEYQKAKSGANPTNALKGGE